jgi:OmcA/MtrC family decaheme c-type cytochrome
VVDLANCQNCHQTLSLHGSNRTDDIQLCVACHNPRNTDVVRREGLETTPPDGKDEESVDFKTMIHAIHAAGMRENPLLVYGFGGTPHLFDEEAVHYPGDLSNCVACHAGDSYTLPLEPEVLATTNNGGEDPQSPLDDTVTTPATAVCSSCHDKKDAAAHMISGGGSFSTTQQAIDSDEVVEQCSVCHSESSSDSVSSVHGLD